MDRLACPDTPHCSVQNQFQLHLHSSGVKKKPSLIAGQSIDSTHVSMYLSDKRKSYRDRSLGPTIASAPSVEQEDYRTPKPSFDNNAGKSFDFSSTQGSLASDTNGLVKVSADFLRLNGSRQQFRNLLSARKKLGTLPPAYTRIDLSRESLDSGVTARGTPKHGPMITVEDTGSQLRISQIQSNTTQALLESQTGSIEKAITFCESHGSVGSHHSTGYLQRNNSRYGVPVDSNAVKMVYKIRSERLINRVKITDRALVLALLGILLMFIECEITAQRILDISKESHTSLLVRVGIVISTVFLLAHVVMYHVNDIMLDLVDCGADDWRVVITRERVLQFILEFICCSFCPFPGTGTIHFAFIESANRLRSSSGPYENREVPFDVILSCFMLSRVFLLARFMVLHSKQFQDASTRTLAALNRIQVNFSFVLKTFLDQNPIMFLSVFTFLFWIIMSWMFVQCERYGSSLSNSPGVLYSNALWFIAITFMLNGYGDIVPQTNAGRIIAIFVGIVGAVISSILIAVISRNILLSQGQRNVNAFMQDSKLMREHKNAAARVLQQTWRIHKCLRTKNAGDGKLRMYQRSFLKAIHTFRSIKNEIRIFGENNYAGPQQVTRLVTEMHTTMQKLVSAQDEMKAQIEVLQRAVRNHYTTNHASRKVSSASRFKENDDYFHSQ